MKRNSLWMTSLLLLLLLPLHTPAQTADEIVKKALDARGGEAKIRAVKAERVTGRVTFAPGVEGPFLVELKRPHKLHLETTVQGQKILRVYDGKSQGWVLNPLGGSKEVQQMSAEDLKNIDDESDFDGPLVDYKAKGNQIEFVGKELFDDKPVYRLKVTNKNGEVRFYIFDASSYVLLKWEGTRKGQDDKEIPWESVFLDYREVKGLKYAFEIDSGSPGTELKQNLIADKIEIDPEIDDSHFAKAAADAASSAAPPK